MAGPQKRTPSANLTELALAHGTDKASTHNYTVLYERYLRDRRDDAMGSGTLLELGVRGGASLAMWRDWLPGWTILGLDNGAEGLPIQPGGTKVYLGDQADAVLLNRIAAEQGAFDVIVDDASHISSLTIASFKLLWPHLKPGGWYVVEDTHSSYHDWWYGSKEADEDPDRGRGQTAMHFLKRLADEANYDPRGNGKDDLYPFAYWDGFDVDSVHFHYDIAFVQKRV